MKINIGMFSPVRTSSNLKVACAAASALQNTEFFYFTPQDVDTENRVIHARYHNGEKWEEKQYKYPDEVHVIYDRIRLVGKKYKKVYTALKEIPFTNNEFNGSINKLEIYDKLSGVSEMEKYIIPYSYYQGISDVYSFLNKYKAIIIKPLIGSGGKDLFLIKNIKDTYEIISKHSTLKMTKNDFEIWLSDLTENRKFVVQKYIDSRTKGDLAFDIRVHLMKNSKGLWDFVRIYPRIGVEYEKITPTGLGGYIGAWEGFVKANFGKDLYGNINKELRHASKMCAVTMEKLYEKSLSELGLDFAISSDGQLYILEVNVHRPGVIYYEFSVARRAMGYAKYIAEKSIKQMVE